MIFEIIQSICKFYKSGKCTHPKYKNNKRKCTIKNCPILQNNKPIEY